MSTYIEGSGGTPNGRSGRTQSDIESWVDVSGGTGFALSSSFANGDYGSGGGIGFCSGERNWWGGATGGSGGWNQTTINVTPNQTLQVVVGAGGISGAALGSVPLHGYYANGYTNIQHSVCYDKSGVLDDHSWYCRNGNGGFVLIEWGGDIK